MKKELLSPDRIAELRAMHPYDRACHADELLGHILALESLGLYVEFPAGALSEWPDEPTRKEGKTIPPKDAP